MKTQLKNRTLWFDGTNEVEADLVPELFMAGVKPAKLMVRHPNDDIDLFNRISDDPIIAFKNQNAELDMSWNLPQKYLNLDFVEYILELFEKSTFCDVPVYAERLEIELIEIAERKLEHLFKSLIYIVDVLKSSGSVYGVGRGSSCASFVLYLIGVHKVDPVKYGIKHEEFFHD